MPKILLIEDEKDIAKGIELNLARERHTVVIVSRGEDALDIVLRENPDLIILDVSLPGLSGFDVCRELRSHAVRVPIIMLTVCSQEIDKVLGLEIGADDYVTKPFSIRELMARIHVALRKAPPRESASLSQYEFDSVHLDFERYSATRKGRQIKFTQKEFELLRYLITHRGEKVTREDMLNHVWGYETYPTTRTVDNHILRLRQKLEPVPSDPKYILSVYGEGYRFVG
jgi:DNA-binding response OmpR family regulator